VRPASSTAFANIGADLAIGRDRLVAGPPVDNRSNLFDDLRRLRVSGIEQAASRRQFRFRDCGMPCLGHPQHLLAMLRKTVLKNIPSMYMNVEYVYITWYPL
jgi:hypothetical protein